ncbi:hypothetical protein GCM10010052_05480 [Paenarthrobacter histidinolovorans]|nr:hypothetical protein GCM10010052_05480 [Paenarthrobacter histidinolovorans]
MFRILVAAAEPAAALPLTNEPGKRNEFGCQICGDLNRHNGYLGWAAEPEGLLLALEKAVDNKSRKPRHGDAGQAKENEEEDFKCEYRHDAILTVSR